MNEAMNFSVAPTMIAPTAAIKRVEPKSITDCSKCEGNIHVGVFFDGTNNNREADMPKLKHTNVARMYDAYLNNPEKGYFPSYIPGVGTPFPEIREKGESSLGSGFAIGCEQRVLFAILHVFNALHRSARNGAELVDGDQIAALCCNKTVGGPFQRGDSNALNGLGLTTGLKMPGIGYGDRMINLNALALRLQIAVSKGLPLIKECFIDVFGFSRGAAEARVFCHWLDEIMMNGTLAGVIIHFRFLGIMDTVASAGFVSSVGAGITGGEGGHGGWAESRYLRIPASVQNCVHMIAGHELRKNFPIDTINNGGKLPSTYQEFVYAGAHSDVGGGYAPGDLGIAPGSDRKAADALKLAQLPLNHMFECAIAAGVPMKRQRARFEALGHDPFALSPLVVQAHADFVAASTLTPRPHHEWLQSYLNWRWQVRLTYTSLNQVREASPEHRELLIQYNAQLIADAEFLDKPPSRNLVKSVLMPMVAIQEKISREIRARLFDNEARAVLALAKAAKPTDPRLAQLFDRFVHDSLAGFNHNKLELTGYWRYRKGYLGEEKRLIVENDAPPVDDRDVA